MVYEVIARKYGRDPNRCLQMDKEVGDLNPTCGEILRRLFTFHKIITSIGLKPQSHSLFWLL